MKLLLDEMYSPSIAEGLRRRGVDAIAGQETPTMRGMADAELFVAAQLDERCVVTENVPDFVPLEAVWRREQAQPHHGLVLVSAGTFPRNDRRVVGKMVAALADIVAEGRPELGGVVWLQRH